MTGNCTGDVGGCTGKERIRYKVVYGGHCYIWLEIFEKQLRKKDPKVANKRGYMQTDIT